MIKSISVKIFCCICILGLIASCNKSPNPTRQSDIHESTQNAIQTTDVPLHDDGAAFQQVLAGVDAGHQPWRLNPIETAKAMALSVCQGNDLSSEYRIRIRSLCEYDPEIEPSAQPTEVTAVWTTKQIQLAVCLRSIKTPEGMEVWQGEKIKVIIEPEELKVTQANCP